MYSSTLVPYDVERLICPVVKHLSFFVSCRASCRSFSNCRTGLAASVWTPTRAETEELAAKKGQRLGVAKRGHVTRAVPGAGGACAP